MTEFVFKLKRRARGAVKTCRLYSGRYRLEGESKATTICLHTSDKQVAVAKLRVLVQQREKERCGLVPSAAVRASASTALSQHVHAFVADREQAGRAYDYTRQLRGKLERLLNECYWTYAKDISGDSFAAWEADKALYARKR